MWYKTCIKSRPSNSLTQICPYHMGQCVVVWTLSNCKEDYLLAHIKETMEINRGPLLNTYAHSSAELNISVTLLDR